VDPTSKLRFQTEFGFVPGAKRPYWARYRCEDGTWKVASFEKAPWAEGKAEYNAFQSTFKGDPNAPVPGGNVFPEPEPGYVRPTAKTLQGLPSAPSAPKIVNEDITTGPHGPNRPMADVVARAWAINPRTGRPNGPQGRWLNAQLAQTALNDLDVPKMTVGRAYSVSLPQGAGEVVRVYDEFPDRGIPKAQRFMEQPADRAVVIRNSDDSIHTFPIGPEHPAHAIQAPLVPASPTPSPAPTP
jgi:hypothetical protein